MKQILYIALLFVAFTSCQKVIDVDLNDANQNVVIEANYTGEDSTVNVRITLTSSYFTSDISPEVDNATVTITDEAGNSTNVPSIGNGNYQLTNYIPNYGTTYTLSVVANSEVYTAQCYMSPVVQLEDMTSEYVDGFFGSDGGYVVFLNFYDPANVTNFYEIVLSRNGEEMNKLDDMFTQDDELTDGNFVQRPLFGGDLFDLNDTIGMELRSIDERIYNYVNEAQSISGGTSSAAPANPTTNWDNDALGYFSAYGSSRKSLIIQ